MRLLNRRLTGPELQQFHRALLDAFSLQRFDEMLSFQLSKRREVIALGDDQQAIVFRVIAAAEDESWTAGLLLAALTTRPEHTRLREFAQQFGLSPTTPPPKQLERTIVERNGKVDVTPWRTLMAAMESRVCRVEVAISSPPLYGTGFLLAPDVVITNYHVIQDVIRDPRLAPKVSFRFDYKKMANGVELYKGVVYRLADPDWLIDASPYSALDLESQPQHDPNPDELDYALLRVAGEPGNLPIGGESNHDPMAPPRGWIELSANLHDFQPDDPLLILQHPDGDPLKLALDTHAIVGVNHTGTRVRYRTNTEAGSSGSPCFDINWNLIALHHLGDPNYDQLHKPEYNQGIPISAIVQLLEHRGIRDQLGDHT
jgi:hypothetical protein